MPEFMPGLELSRVFHAEAVQPILERHFAGLPYAAGRLDTGSEELGFDTARSMDHWWGPRLQVFVRTEDDAPELRADIKRVLGDELPFEVRGYSTHLHEVDVATGSVFMQHRRSGRSITWPS